MRRPRVPISSSSSSAAAVDFLGMAPQALTHALRRRGAEMRQPAVIGLGAVGEFAQAPVDRAGKPEAAEFRLAPDISLLIPAPRQGIEPAEITVPQRCQRSLDGPGEAVSRPCTSRLEEGRGAKIRNQHAVDGIAELGILAGVADFDEIADLTLARHRRGAPDLPIAAGVDQHLQAFMAGRQRPGGSAFDEAIGVAMAVEMHARSPRLRNAVAHHDRPIAGRDVGEAAEG